VNNISVKYLYSLAYRRPIQLKKHEEYVMLLAM